MKRVVNQNGKNIGTILVWFASNVAAKSTIGSLTKNVTNAKCHYCQSLRSNTVMHGSQLPFKYWFVAMHLLTSTKKSFSALELKRQLGHRNYNPIWAMLHKLRIAMGKRDGKYKFEEVIELDEGFFSTEMEEDEKDKPLKRGRGSQKKTKVLVAVESTPSEIKKTKGEAPKSWIFENVCLQ